VELKNDERGWATSRGATVVKRTTNITLFRDHHHLMIVKKRARATK